MRGALGLLMIFGILTIVFGIWGFMFAASVTWVGIKVLFWVCLAFFILSVLGVSTSSAGRPTP